MSPLWLAMPPTTTITTPIADRDDREQQQHRAHTPRHPMAREPRHDRSAHGRHHRRRQHRHHDRLR